MVREKRSLIPVGLMTALDSEIPNSIRFGYTLVEKVNEEGYLQELIPAFVDWCKRSNAGSISTGASTTDLLYKRVLVEHGFSMKKQGEYFQLALL